MNQGKAREFVWEFQGNLGLNFDLCRESMALESDSGDDHAVQLTKFERAMATKTKIKHYYSAHNLATRVSFGT